MYIYSFQHSTNETNTDVGNKYKKMISKEASRSPLNSGNLFHCIVFSLYSPDSQESEYPDLLSERPSIAV